MSTLYQRVGDFPHLGFFGMKTQAYPYASHGNVLIHPHCPEHMAGFALQGGAGRSGTGNDAGKLSQPFPFNPGKAEHAGARKT